MLYTLIWADYPVYDYLSLLELFFVDSRGFSLEPLVCLQEQHPTTTKKLEKVLILQLSNLLNEQAQLINHTHAILSQLF